MGHGGRGAVRAGTAPRADFEIFKSRYQKVMVPAAVTGCDMMLCAPREKRMEGLWSPLCPARGCGPRRREAGGSGWGSRCPRGLTRWRPTVPPGGAGAAPRSWRRPAGGGAAAGTAAPSAASAPRPRTLRGAGERRCGDGQRREAAPAHAHTHTHTYAGPRAEPPLLPAPSSSTRSHRSDRRHGGPPLFALSEAIAAAVTEAGITAWERRPACRPP